jgi:RNA binding exosome subunit
MASVPLHYVELRAFSYATEAEDRVAAALSRFLPEETELDRAESEGHFGDPIVVLSARLERAAEIRTVLDALRDLPDAEYDRVVAELDERVDPDCNLYVTLDKQAAVAGDVRLGEGITLRGKVEAYPADPDRAVANARGMLEAE